MERPVVKLRPTRIGDLDFVLEIERDAAAAGFVGSWPRVRHTATLADDGAGHYIIGAESGTSMGYVILQGLKDANRSIELARIVVTRKEQGYGRAALREVLRLAFEDLGAHRLWLDVFEENERARHVYRSLGFVEEGTIRDCVRGPDGYRSLVLMSLLEQEYHPERVPQSNARRGGA